VLNAKLACEKKPTKKALAGKVVSSNLNKSYSWLGDSSSSFYDAGGDARPAIRLSDIYQQMKVESKKYIKKI